MGDLSGVAGVEKACVDPRLVQTSSSLAYDRTMQRPIGHVQLNVLSRLGDAFVSQRHQARAQHQRFNGGWAIIRTSRDVRTATLASLVKRHLVRACCNGCCGEGYVLCCITRAGLDLLQKA
jgi:hypothetical protein